MTEEEAAKLFRIVGTSNLSITPWKPSLSIFCEQFCEISKLYGTSELEVVHGIQNCTFSEHRQFEKSKIYNMPHDIHTYFFLSRRWLTEDDS